MNYKLEKFWNLAILLTFLELLVMNYKLEKFWNVEFLEMAAKDEKMNYKLEKFWNYLNSVIKFSSISNEL